MLSRGLCLLMSLTGLLPCGGHSPTPGRGARSQDTSQCPWPWLLFYSGISPSAREEIAAEPWRGMSCIYSSLFLFFIGGALVLFHRK